jgi:hypothetical protein
LPDCLNPKRESRSGDLANRFIGAKVGSGKTSRFRGTNQKVLLLCANDLCFCAFRDLVFQCRGMVSLSGTAKGFERGSSPKRVKLTAA